MMSRELQLGKYEFFPYEDKQKTSLEDLVDLLMTDEEREKRYRKVRKEIEKFIRRNKGLKQSKAK